ncbi:MAG: SDR family oxidoreductase [Lentisphaerales bacterium]|nr:SDR family oxidoreductase [Lentisphaerales bacterium]
MSKTILITGAGSGLGKGTALGLAKNGHRVIATCENWPQVSELMEVAKRDNVDLEVTKLDYPNKDDHETVICKYVDAIDIFVLNAATGQTGPVAEIPVDRIRQVFEVNVFATLELAQAFAKVAVARGKGKIVFTSSIVGFSTFPYLAPYVSSKHALEAIVQIMREELEGTGVTIATINPGPFKTGFNDRMYDTVDQWYEPGKNFSKEEPLRKVQELFASDDFQLDPQEMIDFMVELIPQEKHKFRNVYPEKIIGNCKEYQDSLWNLRVGF